MTTLEVWQAITDMLTESVPECIVGRCYDITSWLSDIAAEEKPRLFVQLGSIESNPTGSGGAVTTLDETHEFALILMRKVRVGTSAELDPLVPIVVKIMDTFRYRKFSINGESLVLVNSGIGTDGELFDKDILEEHGVFMAAIALTAKTRRTVE